MSVGLLKAQLQLPSLAEQLYLHQKSKQNETLAQGGDKAQPKSNAERRREFAKKHQEQGLLPKAKKMAAWKAQKLRAQRQGPKVELAKVKAFKSELEKISEKAKREKEVTLMKRQVLKEQSRKLEKNRLSKNIAKVVLGSIRK